MVDGYDSSYFSSLWLKQAFQSLTEAESSKTIVMPVMIIGTNNLEEEVATIKATVEKLTKKNKEKEARLKLQEEKIIRLTRKLEKRLVRSFLKNS